MQKVYLLLRSNQQTGPYNLDELLQFDLKPHDLIWIEGKSAGWYYPQELEAVRPHLSFLKRETQSNPPLQEAPSKSEITPAKKVFVSMPPVYVAKEPVPPFTPPVGGQTPLPAQPLSQPAPETGTDSTRMLNDAETAYTNLAYGKKAKRKPLFSASGLVVLCLLAVGLAVVWRLANKTEATGVNVPLHQTPTATQDAMPEDANLPANQSTQQQTVALTPKKQLKTKTTAPIKNAAAVVVKEEKSTAPLPAVNTAENSEETRSASTTDEESAPAAPQKTEPVATDAPKEKKKLRDKIFDLFKKKPEAKTDEAKPAEEEDGRRQSTRRESGSSLAQMVTVKFDIPNNWMMGIKGAKATLSNRSSETITKALIEVRYYNDDNDLLDKRTISFSNIKSKGTQTAAVPEHATATRLEYNVVSAVGNEPVARL